MLDSLGKIFVVLYAALAVFCTVASKSERFGESTVAETTAIASTTTFKPVVGPVTSNVNHASEPETKELTRSPLPSQTELPDAIDENRWNFFAALFAIALAASVLWVPDPRRRYLLLGFILSLILCSVPILGLKSIGQVGLLACIGFLIHFVAPKRLAENSVFLGIGFAFFAFAFAVAGGLALHKDTSTIERFSTAFYEATQLPLMNMSPHDHLEDVDAKFYFNLARVFGCLFAYFVAYKTVVYVCGRAKTQFLLGWYNMNSERPLALVIGLGTVGRQLIRNLIKEEIRVIAFEFDKDSVHIERAQHLGALVIVGDALDDRVYENLPFDAVQSIYVVAGDDRKNLEISQRLLNYSIKRVKKANRLKSDKAPWWDRWCHKLLGKILLNRKAVCHVQLYDSNMQQWMEREHVLQAIEDSDIEMRHFNAQQNAVRDLIQRNLAKPEVRPKSIHEVGLYFIVGFDDLGQEVALGLAHLAHFENLKRSRIVVLCADPKEESERFLARYPKFTYGYGFHETWDTMQFEETFDRWEIQPTGGVTFATNTLFTKKPSSPSDRNFLKLIFQLTKSNGNDSIKPSIIVCDKDTSRSFAWSSEFVDAWRSFCQRNNLQPECPGGTEHPSLTTYFWLQGHKALQEVVKDNERHIPFGLEDYCIASRLLDATLLRQLASVVKYSYDLATSKDKVEEAEQAKLSPVRFRNLKSDLHAAAHSIIKYRTVGGIMDPCTISSHVPLPKIGTVDQFRLKEVVFSDPKTAQIDENDPLLSIGKMEHNRWMAEILLQGYEYVVKEADRVDGNRLPQHLHQRSTLCSWDHLTHDEKLKDLRQAYYVLFHLHTLDSMQGG